MKIPLMEHRCNKCGKYQQKNAKKSNENWEVYDCNVKCDCGGEFVTWLNGEPCKKFE